MEKKKHNILIVDDTKTNVDILIELLGESYGVIPATSGESALSILKILSVDLILLDIMMPNMDGFEVCKKILSNPHTKDIPIIFITAKTDENDIEKAYEIGGSDYILKPFRPKELLAKVKRELKLQDLIKDLEFTSSHDTMTGIFNRRKFFELATKKLNETKEIYALMVDIDNFKMINDNYGHDIGDIVIKKIVATIKDTLDEKAIFGRLGGEEFAIILDFHENSREDIEKIRANVENLSMDICSGEIIKGTITIGVAKAKDSMKDIDSLLKLADVLLYQGKESGRNRVIFE